MAKNKETLSSVMAAIDGKTADYQGWKNYETWNIALWIDNDQGTYDMVREWARELNGSETAQADLSDRIKEFVEEGNPLSDTATMYTDLLQSAIDSADYYEIAGHYIDEVGEEKGASKEEQDVVAAIDDDESGTNDKVADASVAEEQAAVESLIEGK